MINNPIFDLLCTLGVCDGTDLELLQTKTRDRDDIAVYRCTRSGGIFLSSTNHLESGHYETKPPTHLYGVENRAIVNTSEDTLRRKERFVSLVRGKKWLDIGAGSGAVLDQLSPVARECFAVEPQKKASTVLSRMGYKTFRSLDEVDVFDLDCITLFHVLEHIEQPLDILKGSFKRMAKGGRLVVEVPHASDMLIRLFDLESFKNFTFWSEHFVLHTRTTLEALVRHAGFSQVIIEGVQRYPVSNHLHWLAKGAPGGHVKMDFMRDATLDDAYASMLKRIDMTDTLVLTAVK